MIAVSVTLLVLLYLYSIYYLEKDYQMNKIERQNERDQVNKDNSEKLDKVIELLEKLLESDSSTTKPGAE